MFSSSDACELTLDPNTAHRQLQLSKENKEVKEVKNEIPYPFHPDRFDSSQQLLCRETLTGRCYWEVESKGSLCVGVAYRGNKRRGEDAVCVFGRNDLSWCLSLYSAGYRAWHNNIETERRTSLTYTNTQLRIGVYLDWPAGILSLFNVSSDSLIHLHTFYSTFTEPLLPAFGLTCRDGSVSLCQI